MQLHLALEAGDAAAIARHEQQLARRRLCLGDQLHWFHGMLRWTFAYLRGQFAEAERLRNALAPAEHHPGSSRAILHWVEKVAVLRMTVEPKEVIATVRATPEQVRQLPAYTALITGLHAEAGELGEARVLLALAMAQCDGAIYECCILAQAARELNDAASAAQLYRALAPYEGRFAILPGGVVCLGAVAAYLGVAAYAAGDPKRAAAPLEAAIAQNRSCGALPALARSHVHVTELIAEQPDTTAKCSTDRDEVSVRANLEGYERSIDGKSLAAYRERAAALEQELDEASAHADLGRCEQLRAERERLLEEISAGTRFRSRPVERARKAVYNRVREVIRAIGDVRRDLQPPFVSPRAAEREHIRR